MYLRHKRCSLILAGVVCVSIVIVVVVCLNTRMTPRIAYRVANRGALRRVTHAFDNYINENGHPPARNFVGSSENSRVIHSWRVALLPYSGHSDAGAQYDVDKAWDDKHNLEAVKTCSFFATFNGQVSTTVFMVTDVRPMSPGKLRSGIHLVSIPKPLKYWTSPEDVSAAEVWKAIVKSPDLVFASIEGGCVIPFGELVRSETECFQFLNVEAIDPSLKLELHTRILESQKTLDQDKKCSKDLMATALRRAMNAGEK